MKSILKLNKKGVSAMVGYVLLIVIALSISVLVYGWVKYQLPKQQKECPEDVSLIVEKYDCTADKQINLTLSNKGYFTIDGFYIRVRAKEEGLATEKVFYDMNKNKLMEDYEETNEISIIGSLDPNEITIISLDYLSSYDNINMIEIEPFITMDVKEGSTTKEIVLCKDEIIKQNLIDC